MIYFGSSNKISEGDFYEAKETRVKGLETSLPVRARAVAMSHTEISNHAGACNYLFLGLVKIKQTKILRYFDSHFGDSGVSLHRTLPDNTHRLR